MRTTRPPKAPQLFRQGDVLLVAVTLPPRTAKALRPAPRDNGRVVLAYGEVTGHAHAIAEPGVQLLTAPDAAAMGEAARQLLASVGLTVEIRDEDVVGVLVVEEPATVQHEEHGHIPLAAGAYLVHRQREYSPEAIHSAQD